MVYVTDLNIFALLPETSVLAVQKHENNTAVFFILGNETTKKNVRMCIKNPQLLESVLRKYSSIELPENDLSYFKLCEDDDILVPYIGREGVYMTQIKVVAGRMDKFVEEYVT